MAYTFKHGDRPLEGLTIQRAVGRGGFGEVYYALTDAGKQVALKYLRENPEIELRGISQVMNLKSPHLITIYDVKQNAAGDPFVIMEYVSGPSLRELMLAEPAGFNVAKAAFFLSGIAKGLSYLHERGIVHRDLKPANIFYDDGYVKIGDYGLSKHISVSKHSGQTVSVGTVHYMAPEIGSGNYTRAIDIYALGVILFEMLTGRLPYSGASMAEILMRHLRDTPDLSSVPQPFAPVIARALAKRPEDRYQTVDEMLAEVTESADISAGLAAFDVSTLSTVPRHEGAVDPETVTAGHRPPPIPPLDARADWTLEQLPERLQRRFHQLNRKLERKSTEIERKLGQRHGTPAAALRRAGTCPSTPPRRAGHMVVLAIVAGAVGLALAALLRQPGDLPERAVALSFFIIGGTLGPLLVHLRFLQRSPARNTLIDRLAYAAVAGLFMGPACAMAADELSPRMARIILAPMAAMVICDWSRRIENGRLGRFNGWDAFWPGLIGFVAMHITDSSYYAWTAAGVCAAIMLLTQSAAALWPHAAFPAPGAAPPAPPPDGTDAWPAAAAGAAPAPGNFAIDLEPAPRASARAVVGTGLMPRSAALRALFAVLSTIALAVSLGAFFSLVLVRPVDNDVCATLLHFTLAGLAWLPFLVTKARQRHRLPLWRGTLRMLTFSSALWIVALLIALLAFQLRADDEIAVAVFFLVALTVVAFSALIVRGRDDLPNQPATPACAGPPGIGVPLPAAAVATPITAPPAESTPLSSAAHTATPPPPIEVVTAQPSFVGSAANAGLGFLGKLLLVLGLVLALAPTAVLHYAKDTIDRPGVQLGPGVQRALSEGVPVGWTLLPLALGSLFLVAARRHHGALHFFRGCIGCVLVMWAALVAGVWGGPALDAVFTSGDTESVLASAEMWGPLAMTALSLIAGAFLLLWPSQRGSRPIVI